VNANSKTELCAAYDSGLKFRTRVSLFFCHLWADGCIDALRDVDPKP